MNGGAPGDAYRSIFSGSGQTAGERLAREAIQNSVDAARPIEGEIDEVRVDFRFVRREGQEKSDFFNVAELEAMQHRMSLLGLESENVLLGQNRSLDLLYIDDYQTTGLLGNPTNQTSNLRKLLMDLGGSPKANQSESSGGSFGFGKAAYSAISRIGMVFAYSHTHDDNDHPLCVLMGCTYNDGHEYQGATYTGRAFFGNSKIVPNQGVRYDPLINGDAYDVASKLGFKRDPGCGTSVLIVDVAVEPKEVCEGIEKWWWPRILAERLDATVIDYRGNGLIPRPKSRTYLKPFIAAFNCAEGKTPEIPRELKFKEFNRSANRQIGCLGLTIVSNDSEHNANDAQLEALSDRVALVRSPLMVVEYFQKWRPDNVAVAGCYLAHSDIDNLLKLSEPPDHSRWDPEADRLRKNNEVPGEAKKTVDNLLKRIANELKTFRNVARPPTPPPSRRPVRLARALANWFGGIVDGPPPTPPSVDDPPPVNLIFPSPKVTLANGGLIAEGEVKIELKNEEPIEELSICVRLSLQIAEEDGFVASGEEIVLEEWTESAFRRSNEKVWSGCIRRSERVSISYKSAPYDPDWSVRIVPYVFPDVR